MHRLQTLPSIALVALAFWMPLGCSIAEKSEAPGFEVQLGANGKADSVTGVLTLEEFARIDAAFEEVIASGQRTIDALEREIADLEESNADKAREIDSLVRRIEERREELEDQRDDNLLLCALFPTPSTCVLAVIIDNDNRMNQLKDDLSDARTRQDEIRREIRAYEAERNALRAELEPIRNSRARLVAAFFGEFDTAPLPDTLSPGSEEALAFARIDTLEKLSLATRREIGVLVQIRNRAGQLAASLDDSLRTIRALATSVDQLVDESRDHFMDMVEALLAGDADALASEWLDKALMRRTRTMLESLDWPSSAFIDHLVEHRGDPGADLDALAEQLLRELLEGKEALVMNSAVELTLFDHTKTESVITSNGSGFEAATVTVDIEHSWVGDLVLALEIHGERFVLQDRVGGSQVDLHESYSVVLPEGLDTVGNWTLSVEDQATRDEGVLLGWQLVLE